jgi:hypothetical protein
MKVQATVVLTLNAGSLGEAGRVMDDVLELVAGRERVRVENVELRSPAEQVRVTLPQPAPRPAEAPPPPPPRRPPSYVAGA